MGNGTPSASAPTRSAAPSPKRSSMLASIIEVSAMGAGSSETSSILGSVQAFELDAVRSQG